MYSKILVPLDGSKQAEKISSHVLDLARASNAKIVLLRVPLYAYADETASQRLGVQGDREQAVADAKKYLNKLRSELMRLGVHVSTVIPEGQTAPRIIEYARQANVDVIAMFSHVHNSWHRILYGSVVEDVMRGAKIPVLVVSPESAQQSAKTQTLDCHSVTRPKDRALPHLKKPERKQNPFFWIRVFVGLYARKKRVLFPLLPKQGTLVAFTERISPEWAPPAACRERSPHVGTARRM